jgi:hypothetical protein
MPALELLPPPTADLSIEVGHFYARTIAKGPERMTEYFQEISFCVDAGIQMHRIQQASEQNVPIDNSALPVVSLSFMYDDCNIEKGRRRPPAEHIELILGAAAAAGIQIDYIAREGAYIPAAQHMIRQLYPPLEQSGSSAAQLKQAWNRPGIPPSSGAIFTDIELHDLPVPLGDPIGESPEVELIENLPQYEKGEKDTGDWACPTLSSMWQLHRLGRLGMLTGFEMPSPVPLDDNLHTWNDWAEVPAVLQCNPNATPFTAQRTISILPSEFLHVEAAVRVIIANLLHNTPIPLQPLKQLKQIQYAFSSELNDSKA